jgi:hypothetical protein
MDGNNRSSIDYLDPLIEELIPLTRWRIMDQHRTYRNLRPAKSVDECHDQRNALLVFLRQP